MEWGRLYFGRALGMSEIVLDSEYPQSETILLHVPRYLSISYAFDIALE